MIGIVVSRADRASTHIAERLLDLADWTERTDGSRADADGGGTYHVLGRAGADGDERLELRSFDDLHIRLDDPTPAFSRRPDYLVFVSRHAGDTGPLLTCHFTGNFGAAEYGGEAGSFAPACPGVQRALVAGFDEHAPDGYGVAIEGTHHGPTDLAVPAVFAEVGSDEAQWDDPAGAGAVARAVLGPERGATVAVGDPERPRHVVGFGGGHYAPRFERVLRETAWGVGHVGIDWQLDELGHPGEHPAVLDAAIRASDADYALVEGERPVLREALADRGVRVVGESWVRAVDDTPLALVDALEAALVPVADGLRFGERAADDVDPTDGYRVDDLPAELLAEAQGIDADATRAAVETHAVAFETEQAGTRAAGRVVLPVADADPYDALVDALAGVLRGKYDEVAREGDAVVARVESFDPERAATLGVPEGPKFGALSSGEAVEVNGRTIRPETVSRRRERAFPV
ncbi:D-aminoacyl-tRNA deacylase [Halobaculum litoreum]|uniref:D-aminoacyl-tRNA deacylase n=1 Tax=Halobaculum litoreum TaxID=3031998 RepID=A0ABD5XSE7_9EURY|nr:D-aminoacyl-tRNA deacylase [Halobaculum sp. DT92]